MIEAGCPLYPVILLDFSMPELDGPSTAIQIRKLCTDANLACPWMACVTAYTDPQFERIALDAGINRFYTKPVTKENIQEICSHLQ